MQLALLEYRDQHLVGEGGVIQKHGPVAQSHPGHQLLCEFVEGIVFIKEREDTQRQSGCQPVPQKFYRRHLSFPPDNLQGLFISCPGIGLITTIANPLAKLSAVVNPPALVMTMSETSINSLILFTKL